jgi:hypothetical protein
LRTDGWIRWNAPVAAIAIALPAYAYQYFASGAAWLVADQLKKTSNGEIWQAAA